MPHQSLAIMPAPARNGCSITIIPNSTSLYHTQVRNTLGMLTGTPRYEVQNYVWGTWGFR